MSAASKPAAEVPQPLRFEVTRTPAALLALMFTAGALQAQMPTPVNFTGAQFQQRQSEFASEARAAPSGLQDRSLPINQGRQRIGMLPGGEMRGSQAVSRLPPIAYNNHPLRRDYPDSVAGQSSTISRFQDPQLVAYGSEPAAYPWQLESCQTSPFRFPNYDPAVGFKLVDPIDPECTSFSLHANGWLEFRYYGRARSGPDVRFDQAGDPQENTNLNGLGLPSI